MRIRVLAAVVSALAVLSGCAPGSPTEPNAVPPQNRPAPTAPAPPSPAPPVGNSVELDTSPTLAQIKQRRLLLVGVRADEPQFITRDPAGEYQGFDVEIARDLAKRIGLDPMNQVQFRRLPPTLLRDAVTAGNVDVLLGGTADTPQVAAVGPYVVTDSERFLVIRSDDRMLAQELQRMLDAAVADGSWQRAYDATLGAAGVKATPR
ncbi:transporter substrate-binding domain-containing protein [Saccharopolyspora sp. K220]|uniref:transporter substrate-binding domain-containing protein n=1 Tax=Saccharopolyspora soli TaxID=2926618 RepID=UPI001F5AC660|nr:transporter substrate-binding domain-containing protein [Saccharopolyspora soli]MCI2421879.1 transporter substrate-binding domain-containing protein [Saccharopolyspora soli]